MNQNALKKALTLGIPSGALAWFLYGLFTSLFDDDSVFEQMFESSGILFAVCGIILAVVFCYRNADRNEKAKDSEQAAA